MIYKLFGKLRLDRLMLRLDAHRLRILCYHGVIDDRLAAEPWVPHFFVRASDFDRQLRYLQTNAHILPLAEAVARLQRNALPPHSVCITFDDGFANNLYTAYPLLRRYGAPATIFASTAYIESGDLFPFIKLKLLSLTRRVPPEQLPVYKSVPIGTVLERIAPLWDHARPDVGMDQREALRPMTVSELRSFDPALVAIGSHTHRHCILSNETAGCRRDEIFTSVQRLQKWLGRPVRLFSYPNGQTGDFNEADKLILRDAGVEAAVSGIAGANGPRNDPLELRRYPVGLFHETHGFSAEISGFRSAVQRAVGAA